MPIFFDHLQGKTRSVPQSVLDNGGMYVDQITGEVGYIPKNTLAASTYLDPISMLVSSKPPSGSAGLLPFTADNTIVTADSTLYTADQTVY